MQALVYDGGLSYRTDYPMPEPAPGESLVRVVLSAICNTDREILRGYKPGFRGVLGHEFVGVVEQSLDPSLIGACVVGEINAGCGQCAYCMRGLQKHCTQRRVIGIAGQDGCFAQYMAIDTRQLIRVPEGLPLEKAVFCEPLAAALQMTQAAHIRPSEEVAVVGDGRLALMVTQILALTGAHITVFGRHEEKLALFAPYAVTTTQPCGVFDVVAEASGSPTGILTAIGLTRSGGRILLKSTYAQSVQLDLSELVVREITVQGSRCGPFLPALRLLARGLIEIPAIDLYPLRDYERAFASTAFKAGFDMR